MAGGLGGERSRSHPRHLADPLDGRNHVSVLHVAEGRPSGRRPAHLQCFDLVVVVVHGSFLLVVSLLVSIGVKR